jgi:hypothetical protein
MKSVFECHFVIEPERPESKLPAGRLGTFPGHGILVDHRDRLMADLGAAQPIYPRQQSQGQLVSGNGVPAACSARRAGSALQGRTPGAYAPEQGEEPVALSMGS